MNETDGPDGSGEVGSVGEEAAKLFGALAGWARDHGADLGPDLPGDLGRGISGLAEQAAGAAHQAGEHLATGAAECTYCPICRTLHAVREVSPEVREHLAVAASSLMQAAAGFLVAASAGASADERGGVERIDLDPDLDGDGHDPQTPWPEEQQ